MWRGGNVDAIWRGSPTAIHVQGFAAGQRLSDSRSPIVSSLAPGDSALHRLDTRLAGGLLSIDGVYSFEKWAARYRLGAIGANLRDAFPVDTARDGARVMGVADAGVSFVQRGDGVSLSESIASTFTGGRTFGASYARGSATAAVGVSGPHVWFPVSATGTYGRMTHDAPLFEQFALGGGPSLVLDRLLLTQRWSMPVLPAETAVGTSAVSYRVNAVADPVVWYWWGGSTAPVGEAFREWHNVVGLEWSQSIPALAPAGTPAARGQIGAGESLDSPFRHRFRVYASLVINP
jgi:hypothetical protein